MAIAYDLVLEDGFFALASASSRASSAEIGEMCGMPWLRDTAFARSRRLFRVVVRSRFAARLVSSASGAGLVVTVPQGAADRARRR